MPTLLLTPPDIGRITGRLGRDALMRRAMARLGEGLAAVHTGHRELSPLRDGFERTDPVPGVIEWMPHRVPGEATTIKTVSYSPANPQRHGLPTILGTVTRYDDETGALTAVADGVVLTALRTAAVAALAARVLARPDSATVGLVGAGAQAVAQLHALSLVFPVERVLVWDTDPGHLASFADRTAFLGLPVEHAVPEEIAERSDVITTATSAGIGEKPVLPDTALRDHLHVNAIGADLVGKTELPLSLLERALVCPDHREQALREGECQRLTAGRTGPELSELLARPEAFAAERDRLTVFDSTGIALEDHLMLDVLLEAAAETGAGTVVDLEHHPVDALDPYAPHASSRG